MTMYDILTKCQLFSGLKAEEIEALLGGVENISITRHKAGDVVARRDSAYSGLMILLSGKAKGEVAYPSGKVLRMDSLEAPELIAPAFLFGGYNRLPVDVIAESDIEILTLHRGLLFELMQENVLVMSNFIDIISNRANAWSKKIYALSFESLREKVASYLLDNSDEENRTALIPDMAHAAQFFAATRSALKSVLDDMERHGKIKVTDGGITILDRQALKDIIK